MQTPDPTLHDFVLKLLSDAGSREAFDLNPAHALSAAGLPDVTPQDVMDAVPLVMDFASASGNGLGVDGSTWGSLSSLGGWGTVESAVGHGGASAEVVPAHGVHSGANFSTDSTGHGVELAAGPDGVSGHGVSITPMGTSTFTFQGGTEGFDGEFHLSGLDSDTIGRGGDLVTGTVAGFVTDGTDTFAGMMTQGAAALTQHVTGGADTAGGLITDGAGMLSDGLADPTSLHVPSLPAGLPDLTHGLPVDVPALPATPSLPQLPGLGHLPGLGDLPGLGHLPGLGDLPGGLPHLPVDLQHLPVDLPSLPAVPSVPGLPAVPGLPSLPGVDSVHDTVAGVTSHVPLVGDLTGGLTDHLPLGH